MCKMLSGNKCMLLTDACKFVKQQQWCLSYSTHVLWDNMAAAAIYKKFKKLGLKPKHGKKQSKPIPIVRHSDDDEDHDR